MFCDVGCRTAASESQISCAIRESDWLGVIRAVKDDTTTTPAGCWEWQRTIRRGYPVVKIGGQNKFVHRLVLEAKYGGKHLGKQPGHHICANTKCVNPSHLQPVTSRENTAEMLARTYLEGRIADLEAALRELAPDHPLLAEIGLAAAAKE